MSTVRNLSILSVAIALAVAVLVAPMAHAPMPSQTPSTTPQYFTCAEIIPGISGSNPSHVVVWLRLSNVTTPNGLNYLLSQMYYNPTSPYFHSFITPSQFASWYSPPSSVVSYITSLASQYGLTVLYTFPMLIEASGSASAVDGFLTALQSAPSNIQQWILAGECIPIGYFAANSKGPVYKPSYVKTPLPQGYTVSQVLNNAVKVNGKPAYTILGRPSQFYAYPFEIWLPFGLEFIYDEYPVFISGYLGQGYTIAIVDAFGDFNFTIANQQLAYQDVACNDLYTFDQIFGLPNPPSCQVIYPTGMPILTPYNLGIAEGWAGETALDIEYAHAMAPGANILLVVSPDSGDDLFVAVEYVVANQLANFISLSWGASEDVFYMPPVSYNLLYGYDEIFMQAAAEGIGVFAASGDWGAFDLFVYPIEPSVIYPASDPWVTGVGGTTLYATISPTFMVTRTEYAWNWNPLFMWGTGGGYSFTFPETIGQSLIGITYERPFVYEPDLGIDFYTVGHRGVPDIAADANPFTGVLIVLNGVIPPYIVGGTSLATPLSAGMMATVQSTMPTFTIGDLAPTLYLLYEYYPSMFYVTQTTAPLQSYLTGIPGFMFQSLGGQNGVYWVLQGRWNPVNGLGQINVYGLSSALELINSR